MFRRCINTATVLLALMPLSLRASDGLVVLTDTIDFGDVRPNTPSLPLDPLKVIVRSERTDWRLTLTCSSLNAATDELMRDQLQILKPDGTWATIVPELPIELTTGLATGLTGATVIFPLRVAVSYETPVGRRSGAFRLSLASGIESRVPIHYVVPSAAVVQEIAREAVHAIDPTIAGTYVIERRTYKVNSNDDWTLDAILQGTPSLRGRTLRLRDGAIKILGPEDEAKSLRVGEAVTIVRGEKTGERPALVEMRFAISTSGDEPAGDYEAEVEVNAAIRKTGGR